MLYALIAVTAYAALATASPRAAHRARRVLTSPAARDAAQAAAFMLLVVAVGAALIACYTIGAPQ